MKNIMVLIDLSPRSEQVAHLALQLAKQINANLLLCDVLHAPANKAVLFQGNSYWPFDDDEYPNAEALADRLKENTEPGLTDRMRIDCGNFVDFYPDKIREMIAEKEICMIITGIKQLDDLKVACIDNCPRQLIDHASCPVLLVPDDADIKSIDKIAYLTDLRYCDLHVVEYLKAMSAAIYVTHLSAWGTADMDDSYAREFIEKEISTHVQYNKLFLRNIKGENRKTDLEKVVLTTGINALAIVNKKHQMLDKFVQTDPHKKRNYHQLPVLVIPYMDRNW